MKLNQDEAKVLREVVAAIPQVADVIASFPPEHKVGALEAAEGGYVPQIREIGEEKKSCDRSVGHKPRRWVVERSAPRGAMME